MRLTEKDFADLSWHDCHVWGIEIRAGVPEEEDWTSELFFDIDYIVAWTCGDHGEGRFQVAPATLAFHGVSAARFAIPAADPHLQIAIHPLSIDRIARERVSEQRVFLDRPYYRWTLHLNMPAQGEISFGAWGFTQTLRSEPLLTSRQHLTWSERRNATTA